MTEAPTTAAKSGRRWALLVAIGFLLLTVIPYLVGLSFAFDRRFMWLGYNLDDSCVYLSWMRQAADGSFHALNLFTTEPQHGMALNPLFLVLGRFASLTGLPLLAVYHLARIVFGVGLLLVVWEFLVANVASSRARKLAFLFVCFSAGIGWLPAWWESRSILTPIDRWQPEAITFLSLYLSPLFCFSMALQVGILLLLQRGERTGQARYAVAAGLCGLILGLTHTYDVATMAAIWSAYVVVSAVVAIRRKEGIGPVLPTVLQALLAGIIAAPGALYIYAQLKTETVFHKRMEVQTLSVPLYWVLAGYGLTFLFALLGIYGAKETLKPAPTSTETDADLTVQEADSTHELLFNAASLRLLTVWLLVNLAVAYINVPFQRKLLQGAHFPVAILAGVGCVWLIYRIRKTVSPARFRMKAVAITLLLGLTNFYFMARDIGNYRDNRAQTGIHRTYLLPGEINALNWIREHTPPGTAIQPMPWVAIVGEHKIAATDTALACFTPGLIDRPVYCGHWGETPDFSAKLQELTDFALPRTTQARRIETLRNMRVQYLVFSQKNPDETDADLLCPLFRGKIALPSYLTQVYTNHDADVYRIDLPAAN